MRRAWVGVFTAFVCFVSSGRAAQIAIDDHKRFDISVRMQTWAQWLDTDTAKGGDPNGSRVDFSVQNSYLIVKGTLDKRYEYVVVYAGNALGRAGIGAPENGAGSGFALRDGWIAATLRDELKVQVGRMYVPFVRGAGTVTPGALHSVDLPKFETTEMIPCRRVARDDGVTLWGNIAKGKFQYRLAAMDGSDRFPKGSLRLAGRASVSLFTPETAYFNASANIDGKRYLSFGAGFDRLPRFVVDVVKENGKEVPLERDHFGWTVDAYTAMPVGESAIFIAEGAYAAIDQDNTRYTGTYVFGVGGVYLRRSFPVVGNAHPFVRYEKFALDEGVANPPTDPCESELGVGVNLFPGSYGHTFKVSGEFIVVTPVKGEKTNRAVAQCQLMF
jgi:hypothetical protein